MATGTAKGFAVFAGVSPEIIRASAREAEALGYGSFWVNHPGPVDGLGSLAHAAAETRRLDLGVGVIPLHTRGPEAIADGVRQHALAPERLLREWAAESGSAQGACATAWPRCGPRCPPRIIVARAGPKICQPGGRGLRRRDVQWLDPEYARRSADLVRAGAARQKPPMPQLYAYVRVAWTAASKRVGRRRAAAYDSIPRTTPTSSGRA